MPRVMNIRMMLPFSMVCSTCGEYTYIGTKFNSQVEKTDISYYGCTVYRFYGNCQHCKREYTFKTDPATADYVMESGGSRSYECWKDADNAENQLKERDKE